MRRRRLVHLLVAVLTAGMLLAAIILPWAIGPGIVAGRLIQRAQVQPTAALEQPPPGNTRLLAADGSLIAQFFSRYRTPVAFDAIAPVMK
jgi:membrane carboxypeptidase/penicillin-binding protein